jgi:polyhydroxyalkanoate synthesis repressor PhaR
MIRLIKRYGGTSRKLYDTEESRYVSLEDLSAWIRAGQELKVLDSASGEDVTAQTLAQSIYEDHRRGHSLLSGDFLHQVIRRGGQAFTEGVEQVQATVDNLVRHSLDRLAFVGGAKEDMALLHQRLAELESILAELESSTKPRNGSRRPRVPRKTTASPNQTGHRAGRKE